MVGDALKNHKGALVGVVTLCLVFLSRFVPEFVDKFYGQWFYPFYQQIRGLLTSFLPFPATYLVVALLLSLLFYRIFYAINNKEGFRSIIISTFNTMGWLITAFYMLWGFHYSRPSLSQKLGLSLQAPTEEYIFKEYQFVIEQLNHLRKELPIQDTIPWYGKNRKEIKEAVLTEVKQFMSSTNVPVNYKGVGQELHPKGSLMVWSTAGMFFPFSGEALVDAGLPDSSVPAIMAHELSHYYGITGEGECNFVAYRACRSSTEAFIQYAGYLSYYRYAAHYAKRTDTKRYEQLAQKLDTLVLKDMNSRRNCHQQFKDFIPKTRDVIYDQYLKSQGIEQGLDDYSLVYLLEYAYQKSYTTKHQSQLNR